MKNIRQFLCDATEADSYIRINNSDYGTEIKIADCDRSIKLWFNTRTKKRRQKSLKKLNKLITPLLKLQEHLNATT